MKYKSSSNIINKQFLDALQPLIFLQNLFLFPKFVIAEGRMTPLAPRSYTSCFVGALLNLLIRAYRILSVIFEVGLTQNSIMVGLIVLNFVVGCVGTVFSYIVNILQSSNAVFIFIELQEASIGLDVKDTLCRYKLWNIVNVACVIFGYIIYTLLFGFANHEIFTRGSFLVTFLVSVIFDLNIVLATRTLVLTASILQAWNRKMIEILCQETDQEDCAKVMFSAYKKIINAFNLCKGVYQFGIFFHTFQMFHQILYSIELLFIFAKPVHEDLKIYALLRCLLYVAWNYKNFALLANAGAACERFYSGVRQAETAGTTAMATGGSQVRRMCKNVLRLNRASLRRMSAYNLFAVDAALPLRFVCVTVAYIVVLLQFALF